MNRIDILNALIQKNGYKTYCEIGVQAGHCFRGVQCATKIGVDPDPSSAANLHNTSDDFFAMLKRPDTIILQDQQGNTTPVPKKFDIYWIDGLHHADQVERDILNTLDHLEEGGVICCHDMLPTNEFMQLIPQRPDHVEWCGNCWRAFLKLRQERSDLFMTVINTDWGCGIIKKGSQTPLVTSIENPTYADFAANKNEWMNVQSVEWFQTVFLNN